MSTTGQTSGAGPVVVAAPSHPPGGTLATQELDGFQRLSHELQTSLDIEQLLWIFFHFISEQMPLGSMSYHNVDEKVELDLGNTERHSCSYRLRLKDEALGEVIFTRNAPFEDNETTTLENLLCCLVYPLRNALLYRSALQSALRDPLTGVCNRASMDTSIHHEIGFTQRYGTPLSLIVLDIDHFKQINDNYGHAVGDRALVTLCSAFTSTIRTSDLLFRYGGEEFAILLKNTGLEGARLLAGRLHQIVKETDILCSGVTINATISIGIASLEQDEDADSLFDRADKALYRAKNQGRDCTWVAEPGAKI